MLSPQELFKFRKGLDQSLPAKGGGKEFVPDGSWLQNKHIENFLQERERVISEPRVVRRQDLVKGEWNPDRTLVELFHEMRNFWEHMGFVDNKRKWLYPEEAVFLVEASILEIWYQGLPLSIQEAYAIVLGERLKLEYYQVYCHLRRIGYVVLRHQGRYEFTKYERQIGLDKFASSRKKHKNKGQIMDCSENVAKSKAENQCSSSGRKETENQSIDSSRIETENQSFKGDMDVTENQSGDCTSTRTTENIAIDVTSNDKPNERNSCAKTDGVKGEISNNKIKECDTEVEISVMETEEIKTSLEQSSSEKSAPVGIDVQNRGFQRCSKNENFNRAEMVKLSEWNFDVIKFPDFKCSEDTVHVSKPNVAYIPQGQETCFCETEYSFNKKGYINTKKQRKKQQLLDEELVRELDFSYPEIMTGWHKVKKSCRNWKEYKDAVEKEKASWDRSAVFSHLYGNKVKPLVKPELARSTYAVLDQLKVIDEDVPSKIMSKPEMLPDFDVYVPNTKFKKSQPGLPDLRIKVVRTSDPVPDLQMVNSISSYLSDEVPLHWAVVDSGNIAFYSFSDMALPQDISLG